MKTNDLLLSRLCVFCMYFLRMAMHVCQIKAFLQIGFIYRNYMLVSHKIKALNHMITIQIPHLDMNSIQFNPKIMYIFIYSVLRVKSELTHSFPNGMSYGTLGLSVGRFRLRCIDFVQPGIGFRKIEAFLVLLFGRS